MRIGELAATAGVTTKTIRYYESIGLLPEPARTPSGYRDYDETYADRLTFIRRSGAFGQGRPKPPESGGVLSAGP